MIFRLLAEQAFKLYFRQQSFGDYAYNGWTSAPIYDLSNAPVNPLYLTALAMESAGGINKYNVSVELVRSRYLLPYFTTDQVASMESDATVYSPEKNYTLQVMPTLDWNMIRFLELPEEYRAFEEAYCAYVYDTYMNVPEDTKRELMRIALENGIDPDSATIITDIADYVRGAATYNLDFKEYPQDVDHVLYFLTVAREGVCRHYAAAATLLYRCMGIPARFTVGYSASTASGKWTDITADRAHA